MVFCGHCGYQLAPGNTICPRCGTPVDPDVDMTIDNPPEPDNPTVASGLIHAPTQVQPGVQRPVAGSSGSQFTPGQQEPLILGPDGNTYNPDTGLANAPTSMMGSPTYAMPNQASPANPNVGLYPGYEQQNIGNYPQPMGSYPGYMPFAGDSHTSQADYEAMRAELAARNRTGRIVGLLLILLGLLLIIGAMVLYVVGRNATTSAWHMLPPANMLIIGQFL
jgi:hypothetical protein